MFDWTSIVIGPNEVRIMSTILDTPSAPVSSAVAGTTVSGKSEKLGAVRSASWVQAQLGCLIPSKGRLRSTACG
ncbi:hypothetical protein [Sorangium sp. So ce145]|uniref:hypothetical protein n=1 Tax=Sorangium sp. So ce145 TaxID=3133285 RepID=UPI003F5DFE52